MLMDLIFFEAPRGKNTSEFQFLENIFFKILQLITYQLNLKQCDFSLF
jgi:hypothetical protein